MAKTELLAEFQRLLDEIEKFQGFIDKAQEQAGKFSPLVVEKVVKTNRQKIAEAAESVGPKASEVDAYVASLVAEREREQSGAEQAELNLQELQLRKEIGELEEKAFKAEAKHVEAEVAQTKERVAALDAEVAQFRVQAERWAGLAKLIDAPRIEEPTPPLPEPPAPEPMVKEAAAGVAGGADSTIMLGGAEPSEEPETKAKKSAEVVPPPTADAGEHTSFLVRPEPAAEAPPSVVLVCMEGTPLEKSYPFTSDVLAVGRDRKNDIRIDNDVRVSRYHCRLSRRGADFYIEDNKSANGTLVNGERVTESRRLVGGEEILVGDTPFRFRMPA